MTSAERKEQRHEKSALHEDDPELEREFRMLAQLLIDIHLWKQKTAAADESTTRD